MFLHMRTDTRDLHVAVGLLVMMYPILCKVQYERLHHIFREKHVWIHLAFSVVVNWLIAPLFMVGFPPPPPPPPPFPPFTFGHRDGSNLVGKMPHDMANTPFLHLSLSPSLSLSPAETKKAWPSMDVPPR